MLKKVLLMIIVLGLWLTTVQSQTTKVQTLTLQEVQKYALENNRDVKNALLAIDAANKQRWEVTATGFPQVEFRAQYSNLLDIPTQLIPGEIFGEEPGSTIAVQFGRPHNANYGVYVNQLIFSGSYFVGVQASRIFMKLSQEGYERTKLDVKATVTSSFYLVLLAEENRAILQTSLENVRKTHYELEELYKEGFAEHTDVKQLKISMNELENTIRALEQQIEIAYKLLKLQMGLPLEQPVKLSGTLDGILSSLNVDEQRKVKFDPYNNINMKALITQEQLARLSLRNEKTTFLPSLVAFGSIQRDAQRQQFNIFDRSKDWYPTTMVGLQLSWPIFSGGGKIYRVQKAQIELNQATIQKEKVKECLDLQYKTARSSLNSAEDRFHTAKDNRDLAFEVYQVSQEKFKEGIVSSLELTQAHNQYLSSERTYLQGMTELLNADTELKKLLEIL